MRCVEEIYSWIKNILIYMIINTIIMNLLGNKSYKKYVSIVSGMILVLIVISPVMKLMNLEDNMDYYLSANEFSVQASEFQYDVNRMEKAQRDAVFAEYREKIRTKVEAVLLEEMIYLEDFNVTLDQDPGSETFGEIVGMDITAGVNRDTRKDDRNNSSIDNIEIGKITISEASDSKAQRVPSPLEIHIKNRLSDFYNIEQGNINISIQGE